MTTSLPPDIFQRLVQFIQPFMIDPDEREAWLTQAFYIRAPRIFEQIDRHGAPRVFTVNCVRFLIDYKCLAEPKREHSVSVLLNALRMGCGDDKNKEIDSLVGVLDDVCQEPKPSSEPMITAPTPIVPPSIPLQSTATPPAERTMTVFVSYSRKDETIAQRLIADLNAAGHACWFDQMSIKSNENWSKAISLGINHSYAFVTLVSQASNDSKWVLREYLAADEKPNLPIYVLQLEACEIPIQMKEKQATRLFPKYEDGLRKLLEALPVPLTTSVKTVSQRQLELDYLSGLKLENWLKTIQSVEQYTTLSGSAQTKARDASVLMTQKYRHLRDLLGDDGQRELPREQREYTDILQAIRDIKRAVLLGEPGAGKTTTLWRLAKDLFDTAMNDPKAPIPVLVRLGKWTQADEPLIAFIRRELGELGVYLDKLIADKRVVLLLDGLNEIPLAQRKAGKDEQVKAFIEAAYKANPDLIGVISCRERDYTLDLGFDKIDIAPLDLLRIREFVTRYLDPVKGVGVGEVMFWRLAGETARKTADAFKGEFAGKFPDWEPLLWLSSALPEGITWGYSWDEYFHWNRWLRERAKPSSLLTLAQNPYMLMMMTDIYRNTGTLPDNRGALFTQFVDELIDRESRTNERMAAREGDLTAALAKLAYAMQIRRESRDDGKESASTALPLAEVAPALLDDELLYLAGSASFLTVGDTVRFSHQLLQDYFAALYMLLEIRAGRLKAANLWKPANWWEPTGWEEAAILLVGMFPEQIDWVAAANPELAAQCIVRSGAAIPQTTLETYRSLWLPLITDLKREPRPQSRAAIGRALGLADLDNRPGVGLRADGLPDLIWCEVPAGEFIMGSKEDSDNPVRKVKLPTFQISKYPITYKQFQAFTDAPDGFSNSKWWQGLHSDGLQQQQSGAGDQAFKIWNHPRERVSWYDAIAFCRWLSAKLGVEVTLPTEEQWEKAARGTDGRVYPYGNNFDATKGNTDETGIKQTSAVGMFPDPTLPYGVMDMSGNVLEWCLNEYDSGKVNIGSNEWRALRGGSWLSLQDFARAASRHFTPPGLRDVDYGFRVLVVGRPPSNH